MTTHHDNKSWAKYRPKGNGLRQTIAAIKQGRGLGKNLFKQLLGKAVILFVFLALFGSLAVVAVFGYYSRQLPDIHNLLNRYVAESTKIYDRTGKVLLWEAHGDQKRTTVELDQISPYIKEALISAEDKNFYTHQGFSIWSILRSAIKDLFTGSSAGGSTLTQQMIKNTILTNEKTISRKIKELILARQAEQTFSKDEILKIYLNTINYGGVNYGVESAAEAFFGKSAKDITLPEAAVLAAIPQAPTRLSPYGRNLDALMERKNWVLDRMREDGVITKDETDAAKKEQLVFKKQVINDIKAPHFVFYVMGLLADKFGEEAVNQGGLKVITTLDWDKQQAADDAVHNANDFNKTKGANDAALVSLDPKTGEILAMVGSQDYFNDSIDGAVNVAVEKRQPGSSIKPIIYATAIEKGYTPDTVVYDVDTNFAVSGKAYEPKDYDGKNRGPVTMRKALQGSLNIPAVKFLYLAGLDNVMKKLYDTLEYSTINKKMDCGLSLVLGGCEVTLLDHAGAYTAFAQDGVMAKPAAILSVTDKSNNEIFKFEQKNKKVWDPEVARTINNILSDNDARAYVFGANSPLQLGSRPVAAKTGTTNSYNDGWTMGYTPSLVTGVWVGNADGTDMKKGADGSIVAAPIWNAYMKKVLDKSPIEYFTAPQPYPDNLKPVLKGQISGNLEVVVDKISGLLATDYTPAQLRETRLYHQDHNILYYVSKDDPRGPVPSDPATADPAFNNWEAGVQAWVQKQQEEASKNGQAPILTDQVPPTEYDNIHLPEYTPSISIISPAGGQTISSPQFTVQVSASAPHGLAKIEYLIDGVLMNSESGAGFTTNINADIFGEGFHTLKVIAYDPNYNLKEATADLNFKFPSIVPNITWKSPSSTEPVMISQYPTNVAFDLSKPSQGVSVYFAPASNTSAASFILSPLGTNNGTNFSIYWKTPPPPGNYVLMVEVTVNGRKIMLPNKLAITIKL